MCQLKAEMKAMMKMKRHPHILPLLSAAYDQQHAFLLLVPLARFGSMIDLADHLEFDGATISVPHSAIALFQVAKAVLHLSEQSIVHGDLAARNVLVHEYEAGAPLSTHVTLADFESASNGEMDPLCLRPLATELYALSR